jgi:LysR family transcriptional regulator, glycine cleavage system transcriptional activator
MIVRPNEIIQLDLQSLRCFLVAAELRNFRAASSRVALSPAAFGERIQRLEELVGAPLFVRTTRSVSLTEAGTRLLPHALACLEEAQRCLQLSEGRRPLALTLGTRFELGLDWLVPLLEELEGARPERSIHLHFGDSADLLAGLRADRIDAIVSSVRITEAGFDHATLFPESYVFVGAPDLLERLPLRSPADAAAHRLLDVSPDLPLFRYLLEAGADSRDWPFARAWYLGTIAAIRSMVLRGAGVAVLPRYFVEADLNAGRLRQPLPERPLREDAFRLIWRAGHPAERELRVLAEELRGRGMAA